MPAGLGNDAERFAAAVEQGIPPGASVDDDLAQELEIVAMLRSRGAAFAPDPEAKARAKQRLMAVLAEQSDQHGDGRHAAAAQEQTAPLSRILEPTFPSAHDDVEADDVEAPAVTTRLRPVTAQRRRVADPKPAAEETTVAPATRPGRRTGRHSMPKRSVGRSRRPATRTDSARGLRRRGVLVGTAAMVMMVVLGGAGMFASRDALPGESLYAVKRAAESAGLAFTFDNAAKAHRHLELATTRLDEVEQMVANKPQAAADPELISSTMREFDAATGEGSRMMMASEDAGSAGRAELRAWAEEQAARLAELRPAMPTPAAAGADGSLKLLDRLRERAEAIGERESCTEVTSGVVDDLGPLPAEGTCTQRLASPEASSADSNEAASTATGTRQNNTTTPGAADNRQGTAPRAKDESRSTGLLPDLGTGGTPLDSGSEGTSATPDEDEGLVPGVLPPVTLPPLLPGVPGIPLG